jgi:hypothetical protein
MLFYCIISRQPTTATPLDPRVWATPNFPAVKKKSATIASKKATAAAQLLQEVAVQPKVVSAIDATLSATSSSDVSAAIAAESSTTASNVAAVKAFVAVTSSARRGRPPGSTNRPPAKVSTSINNEPGHPKGPGHEQFPLVTWSLTISRVSKNPKDNDVRPELLENVQVFFDDCCVRGIINCIKVKTKNI